MSVNIIMSCGFGCTCTNYAMFFTCSHESALCMFHLSRSCHVSKMLPFLNKVKRVFKTISLIHWFTMYVINQIKVHKLCSIWCWIQSSRCFFAGPSQGDWSVHHVPSTISWKKPGITAFNHHQAHKFLDHQQIGLPATRFTLNTDQNT